MRSPRRRIEDMLESIERIGRYTVAGRGRFDADELVRTWVVHHLQILGEAAWKLPADLRAAHPAVPWAQIMGLRHVLVHDYADVDMETVWGVVEHNLPPLDSELRRILGTIGPEPAPPGSP